MSGMNGNDVKMIFDHPISFILVENGKAVRMTADSISIVPWVDMSEYMGMDMDISYKGRTLKCYDLDSIEMIADVPVANEVRI